MEACASAHYWARELKKLGHGVRLTPAKDVKAYVKHNKNGSVDAAACCEAVRRPTVRTVPVKTPEQQAQLMQHRVRDLLVRQRTPVNALRSHWRSSASSRPKVTMVSRHCFPLSPTPVMAAYPKMRVPACPLVVQISCCQAEIAAIDKRRLVQHRKSDDSKPSPASVFLGRALLSPRFRMLRYSRRDVTSPPGSGLSRASTLLGASSVWGPLASTATDICDASRGRAPSLSTPRLRLPVWSLVTSITSK